MRKAIPVETTKTSFKLPTALWKAAHIRALDEGRDLQDVITSAVEMYLKTPLKRAHGEPR